jgi:hypothetical protein
MQANSNRAGLSDRISGKDAADMSVGLDKLPEYAYQAAILVVIVLLLWTVA